MLRTGQLLIKNNNNKLATTMKTMKIMPSSKIAASAQHPRPFSSAAAHQLPALQEVLIVQDQQQPGVFNVQLNRADKRNTFTLGFWRELKQAFDHLADDPQCRAVVLSANGPSFCAGIDLRDGVKDMLGIMGNEALDTARKARAIRQLIRLCQDSFSSLERCPKPVIAAVHSHCIGAGISLVSCADVRYASGDAIFSIREVDIGIAADVGILQRIHSIAGNDSWARELAFTGRDVSAVEARQFGFVSRVLDSREACQQAALDLARQIASKSPVAVQGTKLAMNYARSHGVEDSLEWILNWNLRNCKPLTSGQMCRPKWVAVAKKEEQCKKSPNLMMSLAADNFRPKFEDF